MRSSHCDGTDLLLQRTDQSLLQTHPLRLQELVHVDRVSTTIPHLVQRRILVLLQLSPFLQRLVSLIQLFQILENALGSTLIHQFRLYPPKTMIRIRAAPP